jgi:hypothetical protein
MADLTNGAVEVRLTPIKVTIVRTDLIHGPFNLTSEGVEVRFVLGQVTIGRVEVRLTPMKVTIGTVEVRLTPMKVTIGTVEVRLTPMKVTIGRAKLTTVTIL